MSARGAKTQKSSCIKILFIEAFQTTILSDTVLKPNITIEARMAWFSVQDRNI